MPNLDNSKQAWDNHYTRDKSKLNFPDENLVRILAKINQRGKALDFGCGSGRHSFYLESLDYDVTASDFSENALEMISKHSNSIKTSLVSDPPYSFESNSFDLLLSWGVIHYNSFEIGKEIMNEYYRILKPNGILITSIRAEGDTHLQIQGNEVKLSDISGASAYLYSKDQIDRILNQFSEVEVGYTERRPLGNLDLRICHWITKSIKKI
jgi:SAM-dependent methyltransferase